MESVDNRQHSYPDLDPDKNEIRLLTLQPGKQNDPIKGRLSVAELNSNSLYNAMSYRWGDSNDKTVIEIDNNKNFSVTRSAEVALQHLRSESQEMVFWMDAICINQQNVEERNHQVVLMQQIYQGAETVYVWLDISLPVEMPAFEALKKLDESSSTNELGIDPEFWDPIRAIDADEYWKRAWIQQEVAFAKNLVIQCRNYVIDGKRLHHFQQLLDLKTDESINQPNNLDWLYFQMQYVDLSGPYRPILNRKAAGSRYYNLLEALASCGHLKATDPRDRVYAILSLVDGNLEANWEINYELGIKETYTKVAKYALEQHGSVAFLNLSFSSQKRYELPSWVPDWSTEPLVLAYLDPDNMNLNCKVGQGPRFTGRISEDQCRLTVYAAQLDEIDGIDLQMPWQPGITDSQDFIDGLCKLHFPGKTLTADNVKAAISIPMDKIPDSRWVAFLSTMLNANEHSIRLNAEYLNTAKNDFEVMRQLLLDNGPGSTIIQKFRKFLRDQRHFFSRSSLIKKRIDSEIFKSYFRIKYVEMFKLHTLNLNFAITESGRFSLAPPEAQPGDQIWAVLHCPQPIVLRPVDNHFEVIGPCYLHDEHTHIVQDLLNGLADEERYPLLEIELW